MLWFLPFILCAEYSIFDAINRPNNLITLDNGLPVLWIKSKTKYSRLSFSINTEGLDDLKQYKGITHLLEHVIFNINSPFTQFVYDHGGSVLACTEEKSMIFVCVILSEYFVESLEFLFGAFNNPIFDINIINSEIDLIEDEFKYRCCMNHKLANLYTEVDDLGVFICGNKLSLQKEGVLEGIRQIHRDNFLGRTGSIVCISDCDYTIFQNFGIKYTDEPQERSDAVSLQQYYRCTERMTLVESDQNVMYITIQIPLQENPFMVNYLFQRYTAKMNFFGYIRKIDYRSIVEDKYTSIKMHIFIKGSQAVHPLSFIRKLIDCIKSTRLIVQVYEELLKESYEEIIHRKPLDQEKYSTLHKYVQNKKFMFNENYDKDECIRFKASDFIELINNLIDIRNYSFIYECHTRGDLRTSEHSKIDYMTIENKKSNSDLDKRIEEDMKWFGNTKIMSWKDTFVNQEKATDISTDTSDCNRQTPHMTKIAIEPEVFDPLSLLITDKIEFLEDPLVTRKVQRGEDRTKKLTSYTYEAHIINIKDSDTRITVFRFTIDPTYDNFLRLLYVTQSLKISFKNYFTLEAGNTIDFRLSHDKMEIIWTNNKICNNRLIFCLKLAKSIAQCRENINVIFNNLIRGLPKLASEIAEKFYMQTELTRDFRKFVVSLNCDRSDEPVMPPYYMVLCLLGDIGPVSVLEVEDLMKVFDPTIPITSVNMIKEDHKIRAAPKSGYTSASLYIPSDPNATKKDLVVRLCCFFALYRMSETLRVKEKIGYYVITDFTSTTYYSDFAIETLTINAANNIADILSDYIQDVINSIKTMPGVNFRAFLDVVYNTFKLSDSNLVDVLHFYRKLDFKFDYITFNSELRELLSSIDLKKDIARMLDKDTVISIMN